MLIKAEQKYVRTSPRKLRFVADGVRGIKDPQRMLAYLEVIQKRAASPLAKTLKQAISNATNNLGLSASSLTVKEIMVGEGPTYKRGRPVARGRFHPIQKKTSHIRIVLEAEPPKTTKSEIRNSKPETKVKTKDAKK